MASINKKVPKPVVYTHGGAPTYEANAEEQLCRAVMSCMLWEASHYESGESIVDRIRGLIPKVSPQRVAQIAIDARTLMKIRHAPLLLVREMARLDTHKHLVSKLLPEIIQRADELCEFVALYWMTKKEPLSAQVKKGLAAAFVKFNEYALGKNKQDDKKVTLRDILFLVRPRSKDREQKSVWKKLAEKTLQAPKDSWEVLLSAEGNNERSWNKLLKDGSLNGLSLIRNLRNMTAAGVNKDLVKQALLGMNGKNVLPFQYISAAKYGPEYESEIEQAMLKCLADKPKLPGKSIIIIDVSGSMYGAKISEKSEVDRAHAACSMAVLARELCENPVIYATGGNDGIRVHKTQIVPARRGFALLEAIYNMQGPLGGGGIFLEQVMNYVKEKEKSADRVIIITDEQDCSGQESSPARADAFGKHNYIINVNTYQHGIGYGKWTHINSWSEAALDYIRISEEGFKFSNQAFQQQSVSNQVVAPKKAIKKVRIYAKKAKSGQKTNRNTSKSVSRNRRIRKVAKS